MTATQTTTTVDLVKGLYAAFGSGDIAFILQSLTPDCQWISSGVGVPNAGRYTGPAGAAQFFQRLAATEEVTKFEPREYFTNEAGDVVAHGYEECRMAATGKTAATSWMMVFRFDGDKVKYFETFYDTSAYAEAHRA